MNRNVKVLNWASLPPLLNDDDKNDRENAWEEKGNTICKMISKQETQMRKNAATMYTTTSFLYYCHQKNQVLMLFIFYYR